MSEERKRGEKKEIPKVVPKKRVEVILPEIKPIVISPVIIEPEIKEPKTRAKPNFDKYIRICEDANSDERRLITDKLSRGEIVFGYYAIDNDKSYHYYLIIKK